MLVETFHLGKHVDSNSEKVPAALEQLHAVITEQRRRLPSLLKRWNVMYSIPPGDGVHGLCD